MSTATRLERDRIDAVAFRQHLINAILMAGTLGIIVFSCCAFTIAFELHAMRVAHSQALAELQHGFFSRMDSVLWKIDTFLITFSATNQSLAKGLTQVRVQVKESQDAQTQNTKEIGKVATTVAKESLKATENAVQAVVDKPLSVEVKSQPPTTVKVEALAPVVAAPKQEEAQKPPVSEPDPPKKRRWYRLWLSRE